MSLSLEIFCEFLADLGCFHSRNIRDIESASAMSRTLRLASLFGSARGVATAAARSAAWSASTSDVVPTLHGDAAPRAARSRAWISMTAGAKAPRELTDTCEIREGSRSGSSQATTHERQSVHLRPHRAQNSNPTGHTFRAPRARARSRRGPAPTHRRDPPRRTGTKTRRCQAICAWLQPAGENRLLS
jgi:hypothetical protein